MQEHWYYVENNNRVGPIEIDELKNLLKNETFAHNVFVWKKGFDNWKKASEVQELNALDDLIPPIEQIKEIFSFENIDRNNRIFSIKIGVDRGGSEAEYGPYSLNTIIKLFKEKRVNGKTMIYTQGMDGWSFLADLKNYDDLFSAVPPAIEEKERRRGDRKPFVAQMLFHDSSNVFEGVCRDISVGGLQVLISKAPVKAGDKLSMNVFPGNGQHMFVASGRVVRILDGDVGFSLRFEELRDEAKYAIESYLKELK